MPDTKATDETAASAMSVADGIAIVQGGVDRYATFQLIMDLALTTLGDDDVALTADSDDLLPTKSAVRAYVGAATGPPAVVTDATSNRNLLNSDAGTYIRMTDSGAKTLTVQDDVTEPLDDDVEFHVRCVDADLTLTPGTTDVMLNPPSGGTLVLSDGMTVTLKRVAVNEFDVIGQTVAV